LGRYFSTHGGLRAATTGSGFDLDEDAAAAARAEFEKKLAMAKMRSPLNRSPNVTVLWDSF